MLSRKKRARTEPAKAQTQPKEVSAAVRAAPLLLEELTRIAHETSGIVGLSVVALVRGDNVGSERLPCLNLRGHERFPMASTFKVPLAISVLKRVDAGSIDLAERVTLGLKDVRPGTGVLAAQLLTDGTTESSLHDLLEKALNDSDNTATDFLLERIGGPERVQQDMREIGLNFININRGCLEHLRDRCGVTQNMPVEGPAMVDFVALLEGKMEVLPLASLREADRAFDLDERDTTSPQEMTELLRKIWYREAGISENSTTVLLDIMAGCRTGKGRIPGRLPAGTKVMHKTGSLGGRANNVGYIELPGDGATEAIALSVYVKGPAGPGQSTTGELYAERDRAIADLARACYDFYLFSSML